MLPGRCVIVAPSTNVQTYLPSNSNRLHQNDHKLWLFYHGYRLIILFKFIWHDVALLVALLQPLYLPSVARFDTKCRTARRDCINGNIHCAADCRPAGGESMQGVLQSMQLVAGRWRTAGVTCWYVHWYFVLFWTLWPILRGNGSSCFHNYSSHCHCVASMYLRWGELVVSATTSRASWHWVEVTGYLAKSSHALISADG